jgi:hypothetical protein
MKNRCEEYHCLRKGPDEVNCDQGQSRNEVVHLEEIMQALVFCLVDKRCDRFEVVLCKEPSGQWLKLLEVEDRVIDDRSFFRFGSFTNKIICLAKIGANHDEQEQHKLVIK